MNKWTLEYYGQSVQDWIMQMPVGIRAHYARLADLLMEFGKLSPPQARAMGEGLFELRVKGKEGIARIFYTMLEGKKIALLHGYIKKSQKTPKRELKTAKRRMKEVKSEQ